ncbi:MAG: Na/Pi symporter [Helicobacter sp.]|nr:Na/Pi symporter [Helicobacteraceae bacterium]MDY3113493.1 Na/Pi symporter [Helicobacter sp.]
MKRAGLLVAFLVLGYIFSVEKDSIEIIAGVAIFLFGMFALEDGFKLLGGGVLEKIMRTATSNTLKAIGFGTIATALMQSSTLISLFSISFVSAGIISLAQGVGVIFGANLGTTTGAWIIAGIGIKVDIASYALPLIAFGVICMFVKDRVTKGLGYVLVGIGFIFLGIAYIKEGFDVYKEAIDLTQYSVSGFKGVIVFTFIGILFTIIAQSSHATLVIVISALAAGQVTYENALAMAIGANLGSSITTALGALNSNLNGKRLALAHIIFNGVTAVVAIVFIYQLVWLVNFLGDLLGISDDMLRLAIFHTIFNALGILLMLPFMSKLIHFLFVVVRNKKDADSGVPMYLADSALEYADTALEVMRNETKHLYNNAFGIIAHTIGFNRRDIRSFEALESLVQDTTLLKKDIDIEELYENTIKPLDNAIMEFSIKAKAHMQNETSKDSFYAIQMAAQDIVESVKLLLLLRKNIQRYSLSDNKALSSEYNHIRKALARLLRSVEELKITPEDDNEQVIRKIEACKKEFSYDDLYIVNKTESLVYDRQITLAQSTSLVNDLSFVRTIATRLLSAVDCIYLKNDLEVIECEEK